MNQDIDTEFDPQRDLLVATGYPELVGLSRAQLLEIIEPLRAVVQKFASHPPDTAANASTNRAPHDSPTPTIHVRSLA